jgi:autotransporter
MEKTAVKLVRDKRKAVNANKATPVSGLLVYGDNNHKYNLGFVPTIWDDANEMLIVAHQNSDPYTDGYREPLQITVMPYEMIQYMHVNMDLQNARALMKEFGFEDKIIDIFLNEQCPTTDMYSFGAVRKGELEEIYKIKDEQERQAQAALDRMREEQRARGIGVHTYDKENDPKDVPMAGPQTVPSAPVEDTTADNVPVVKYRLDDPLYDPRAVRSATRSIEDAYPYPTPNVPDLTYLGVHADETNTGTILPVTPQPTPGPVTPPVSPTPGHGTGGTTPVAPPTPSSGTGSTTTPVTPGGSSGTGSTGTTPSPTPGPAVTPTVPTTGGTTPTPSQGQGGNGTTPVAPAIGTTVPVTPAPTPGAGGSATPAVPTPTPITPAPSVPVAPTPTPVNGLSANGAIDLFAKLNKIISDKLAGHNVTATDFDNITPEYTTTAGDQISKHDFNTSLGALSTTLANIHGGTPPAITVAEDANPVESTVVDNLIATVKAMVL